jgi:hypothetical protein
MTPFAAPRPAAPGAGSWDMGQRQAPPKHLWRSATSLAELRGGLEHADRPGRPRRTSRDDPVVLGAAKVRDDSENQDVFMGRWRAT